jgi:hypothetical protein
MATPCLRSIAPCQDQWRRPIHRHAMGRLGKSLGTIGDSPSPGAFTVGLVGPHVSKRSLHARRKLWVLIQYSPRHCAGSAARRVHASDYLHLTLGALFRLLFSTSEILYSLPILPHNVNGFPRTHAIFIYRGHPPQPSGKANGKKPKSSALKERGLPDGALTMATRTQERQRSYKKGIDVDVTRRRREDTTTQIRKSIREDRLNQRRRMGGGLALGDDDAFDEDGQYAVAHDVNGNGVPRVSVQINSDGIKGGRFVWMLNPLFSTAATGGRPAQDRGNDPVDGRDGADRGRVVAATAAVARCVLMGLDRFGHVSLTRRWIDR